MSVKVMAAIPTTDYVHINFSISLASMVLNTKIPLSVQVARGSSICQNRNTLVNEAKKAGAEFILFLDNDMSFPWFVPDRLVHWAEERKLDIIGCNYLFKAPPHQWMVMPFPWRKELESLEEVSRLPTGMMLVRMSVFDKLEPPYFSYSRVKDQSCGETVSSEDYYFCDVARRHDFKVWMDTDLSFGIIHWGSPVGVRWIREEPGYQYMQEPLVYSALP